MLSQHHQQVHKTPEVVQNHPTPSNLSTIAINEPPCSPSEESHAQDWISNGLHVPQSDTPHAANVGGILPIGASQTVCDTVEMEPFNLSSSIEGVDGLGGRLQFPWSDLSTLDQLPNLDFFDLSYNVSGLAPSHHSLSWGDRTAGSAEQHIGAARAEPMNSTIASRLPSLEPGDPDIRSGVNHSHAEAATRPLISTQPMQQNPWRISTENYQQLIQELTARTSMISGSFILPPRQALSRYLEGYFRGLNAHMPFLHIPTLDHGTLGFELVLSLAANGAMYRFKHEKAIELYRAAKRLIMFRLDELVHNRSVLRAASNHPDYLKPSGSQDQGRLNGQHSPAIAHDPVLLRLLQALLILMATRSWGKRELICESLSMASKVASLSRDLGINIAEPTASKDESWEEWIIMEERRRTLFVAFVLFGLQTITFDVPPVPLNREVCLTLPASAAAWKAESAGEWTECQDHSPYSQQSYQKALAQLLSGKFIHEETPLSAFGNYVLIHGLSIQVFLARNATDPFLRPKSSTSEDFVEMMENALRAWQKSWEATHESSLDPSSPKGSLGFNCTAVLRLVHIRLHVNVGLSRHFLVRDPAEIAHAYGDNDVENGVQRSPKLDMAILQCIYALSIPVRVGIAFVARTLTLDWSCQHAVSSLECAFLPTHWLRTLANDVEIFGQDSLRRNERKMLEMVVSLIRETDLADSLDEQSTPASQIRRAAALTARLWAETFKGFHVFEVVYRIGETLSLAAESLEKLWLDSLWPHGG